MSLHSSVEWLICVELMLSAPEQLSSNVNYLIWQQTTFRLRGPTERECLRCCSTPTACSTYTDNSTADFCKLINYTYLSLPDKSIICNAGPSGHAVWGGGLDRLDTEISWVRIQRTAWMFVLVYLCCVVLCRYRTLRRADQSSKGVLPSV
jgi:hypothetical protein